MIVYAGSGISTGCTKKVYREANTYLEAIEEVVYEILEAAFVGTDNRLHIRFNVPRLEHSVLGHNDSHVPETFRSCAASAYSLSGSTSISNHQAVGLDVEEISVRSSDVHHDGTDCYGSRSEMCK